MHHLTYSVCKMLLCAVVFLALFSFSEGFVKMIATPVVYTNNNGGGSDEVEVPASGEAIRLYEVNNVVCEAWWVPYDNIPDLSAVYLINVEPSGTQVRLRARGVAHTGRVRIKFYAFLCG